MKKITIIDRFPTTKEYGELKNEITYTPELFEERFGRGNKFNFRNILELHMQEIPKRYFVAEMEYSADKERVQIFWLADEEEKGEE